MRQRLTSSTPYPQRGEGFEDRGLNPSSGAVWFRVKGLGLRVWATVHTAHWLKGHAPLNLYQGLYYWPYVHILSYQRGPYISFVGDQKSDRSSTKVFVSALGLIPIFLRNFYNPYRIHLQSYFTHAEPIPTSKQAPPRLVWSLLGGHCNINSTATGNVW